VSAPASAPPPADAGSGSARLVGAGILLSRITGLLREMATAQYLGTTIYADVFRAALRMPNVLQNLLGEGTLSASFIPVYSELLEQGRKQEAGRFAGAIFALLLGVAGALALLGVLLAPVLVSIFLPGFEGVRRELTITSARIIFPMTGILVLSAWALGVLNSHRRFFIPYVAPVLWNGAIIAVLVLLGGRLAADRLVVALAWGALGGGVLQFLIQLPWVLRLERDLRINRQLRSAHVKVALSNAGPAVLGRGVVQLNGWVELFLASLLAGGAVAALGYAQTLYLLPVSLFGMSVAAAELPELARRRLGEAEQIRLRVNTGLRRIAFFVIPSAVGYLVIGDVIVAALYQRGGFGADDTLLVYLVLAAFAFGLPASTGTRLFSSAYFALHDTRTPAKLAGLRLALSAVLGYAFMLQFETVLVNGRPLGPVGLGLAGSVAATAEWLLLGRFLSKRIGKVGPGLSPTLRMILAALLAGGAGQGIRWWLPPLHPVPTALVVLAVFGAIYFGVTAALGLGESGRFLRGIGARAGLYRHGDGGSRKPPRV
jgi:putative peptidoglycan lipid II flippase